MLEPVKWSTKVEAVEAESATLVMIATIDKGWHLYSQFLPDGGPIKTTFSLIPSSDYELIGTVTEGKATDFYDKNFEMQLKYFSNKAEFRQNIKVNTNKKFKVEGNVEFMVCDDEKCLPPNMVNLSFDIKQ